MTDKIKEAREDVEHVSIMWGSTKYRCVLRYRTIQTILKALSAYEKLQGMDLAGMKKPVKDGAFVRCDQNFNMGYNQAIDDVKARLVADINNEERN